MELLIIGLFVLGLIVFGLAAANWGADSRDLGLDSRS